MLSFRFVHLSERMEVIALDERTASVFEGRLSEITDAMVGEADNPWEECKKSFGRAHEVLTYWELKGRTATLELALWRTKIETARGERAGVIANDQTTRDLGNAVSTVFALNISSIKTRTWPEKIQFLAFFLIAEKRQ